MKFGVQFTLHQNLLPKKWQGNYVRYDEMKQVVREISEWLAKNPGKPAVSPDCEAEKKFQEMLADDLKRVNTFYTDLEKKVVEKMEKSAERFFEIGLQTPGVIGEKGKHSEWKKQVSELFKLEQDLREYASVNTLAFEKILKKHDKYSKLKMKKKWLGEVLHPTHLYTSTDLDAADKQWHATVSREVEKSNRNKIKNKSPKSTPKCFKELDLEALEAGHIHNLWIGLSENEMGQEVSVPVLVAKGRHSGPIVGITAALHGNELNGIPLIHRYFEDLDVSELHGTVVAVVIANVPGFLRHSRYFADGEDLNRIFPGKPNGNCSQVYVHRFLERVIKKLNYLIDLHTASHGRINSLYVRADMNDPVTSRMALLQNPQIVLHNTGPDGSLRGSACSFGIPAITVEIGNPSSIHKKFVNSALLGVTNIIEFLHMTPPQEEDNAPHSQPIMCSSSRWLFATAGGILEVLPQIAHWVHKGDVIAVIVDVFGNIVCKYEAPDTGIVIGKNVDPACQVGDRLLHLGFVGEQFKKKQNDGH